MDRVPVPRDLKDFSRIFSDAGHRVYLVGGAVRDRFLGKKAEDWDVATDALPEQVMAIFPRVIPTGIEHGTVTIPFRGHAIECTTFRAESEYTDGRRPDSVRYDVTIEEDLSRRDFTMNAIAVSLPDGAVVDPFGGRDDVSRRIIRAVGDPSARFAEDGLRPLRAVRFSALSGFGIDEATLNAIPASLGVTAKVAPERVRDELLKLLSAPDPLTAFGYMETTGLMELILPELSACRGVEQKGRHRHDVLDHILLTCSACPREVPEISLAGLFHDVGKPSVRAFDANGAVTFHGHETASARIARSVMTRLKFPNRTIARVCHLVEQHMFHYESSWTDAAIRRFVVRVGTDELEPLFALRAADSFAISGVRGEPPEIDELRNRIAGILAAKHAFSLRDLAVNGSDLGEAGIPPGPITGMVLRELLSAVLDDPELNEKSRLLEIARAFVRERRLTGRDS